MDNGGEMNGLRSGVGGRGRGYPADGIPAQGQRSGPCLWTRPTTRRCCGSFAKIPPHRHQVRMRDCPVRCLQRLPYGKPPRSCSLPVAAVGEGEITTIEGLSGRERGVQRAWVARDVPQCGYRQSGQVMSAGAAEGDQEAERPRHRSRHERQPLPLRHLCPHPGRHPRCGAGIGGLAMGVRGGT